MDRNERNNSTRKKVSGNCFDIWRTGRSSNINAMNIIPVPVTDVFILAVTGYGCVEESELGVGVVVEQCDANVGDTISSIFYVPAMVQNGYDRIEAKLVMVES